MERPTPPAHRPHGGQRPPRGNRNWNGKKSQNRQGQNLRARGAGFKRSHRAVQQEAEQLGFFGTVPSLQDLQRENRRRTRRHYRADTAHRRGATPQTVPPAPLNETRELLKGGRGNPLATPAPAEADVAAAATRAQLDSAGLHSSLDFYGSNEGMTNFMYASSNDDDSSSDDSGDDSGAASDGGAPAPASHPPTDGRRAVAARPERGARAGMGQDAYLARLEDDNLRLKERLDLMQRELAEVRAALALAPSRADAADSTSAVSATSAGEGDDGDDGQVATHRVPAQRHETDSAATRVRMRRAELGGTGGHGEAAAPPLTNGAPTTDRDTWAEAPGARSAGGAPTTARDAALELELEPA